MKECQCVFQWRVQLKLGQRALFAFTHRFGLRTGGQESASARTRHIMRVLVDLPVTPLLLEDGEPRCSRRAAAGPRAALRI